MNNQKAKESNSSTSEETKKAVPVTEPPKVKSLAGEELNKFMLVRHGVSMYQGIMGSTPCTKVVADKVDDMATAIYQSALQTKVGKTADEVLAHVTSASRKVVNCIGCGQDNDDSGAEEECTEPGLMLQLFHLWFRYFLPLLLLRWFVDLSLLATELCLALVKDFVRLRPNTMALRTPAVLEVSDLEHRSQEPVTASPSKANKEEDKPETSTPRKNKEDSGKGVISPRPAGLEQGEGRRLRPKRVKSDGLFEAFWSVVLYFLLLIYFAVKMFAIYVAIPVLSIQFMVLDSLSSTLHHLAGIDDDYNGRQDALTREERKLLGSHMIPHTQNKRKWMTDSVLERAAKSFEQFPLGGALLNVLGVSRPVGVVKRMQKVVRKQISIYTYRDMAPYLRLDSTYYEDEDPDFEPYENSDDSSDTDNDTDVEKIDKDGGANGNGSHVVGRPIEAISTDVGRQSSNHEAFYPSDQRVASVPSDKALSPKSQ